MAAKQGVRLFQTPSTQPSQHSLAQVYVLGLSRTSTRNGSPHPAGAAVSETVCAAHLYLGRPSVYRRALKLRYLAQVRVVAAKARPARNSTSVKRAL